MKAKVLLYKENINHRPISQALTINPKQATFCNKDTNKKSKTNSNLDLMALVTHSFLKQKN